MEVSFGGREERGEACAGVGKRGQSLRSHSVPPTGDSLELRLISLSTHIFILLVASPPSRP